MVKGGEVCAMVFVWVVNSLRMTGIAGRNWVETGVCWAPGQSVCKGRAGCSRCENAVYATMAQSLSEGSYGEHDARTSDAMESLVMVKVVVAVVEYRSVISASGQELHVMFVSHIYEAWSLFYYCVRSLACYMQSTVL